ncbi:uncharacterized protein LAESUDRAFT_165003 [Laetiporus sulphureus 93-53]|uniref:Uncharacterized protein n=1 Tax=Laetiporus sulphureus 93-53 TaxID=1314785 RepID=A0A165HQP1_9APHY|nr:uncharacterized protein LAESUDRAFT_165003 [Laetiporus sulphureus 93-53]KZT12058.1 hypothetical protein LAESUDRAFT_165003 [Laetiporus sulphureus 93-53]
MSPTIETDENASRTPVYGSRSRANSLLDVYRSTELAQAQCVDVDPPSSLSSLSASSSSLNAESTQDDFCQAAVYSPVQAAFPAFHLPSTPRRPTWDGESLPSLKTSTSYSSLSTPSLSRTSSFHRSPPVSPTAATLSTPVDMTPVSAHGHLVLEVIEEVSPPEDAESPRDLFYSDARGNSSLPNLTMQAQPGSVHECGPSQEAAQERSRSDNQPAREHQVHRPKTANVASAVAVSSSRSGSPAQHVSRTVINRSKRSASNAIARFFTKEVKKTQTVEHLFHFNGSALNLSMAKAEEKKRKKAAARAQIDKLAVENVRSPLEVHAQRNDRLCH